MGSHPLGDWNVLDRANATSYLERINPDTDTFLEKLEEKMGQLEGQKASYLSEVDR